MDELSISVSMLNEYIYSRLDEDAFLDEIWIKGELSDIGINNNNAYFVLKDETAGVECVLYNCIDYADVLIEGQSVFVRGSANIYKRNARFKLTIREIQVEGAGDLYLQFEKIKQELEDLGVFDPEIKKQIPLYPFKIGVVTSKHGAVLHDIKNIVNRRNPCVKLYLYPVKVQGEGAEAEIAHGVDYFNKNTEVDLIIIARGGGSLEDLFAFNTKEVVLSVYNSKIPVISGVGHETDFTLCDFAADLRAPTPSAAAEIAVKPKEEIVQGINYALSAVANKVGALIAQKRMHIKDSISDLNAKVFYAKIGQNREKINFLSLEINSCVKKLYKNLKMNYNIHSTKIDLLNPYSAFERGYVIAKCKDVQIKSINDVSVKDKIELILKDGSINATVNSINGDKN